MRREAEGQEGESVPQGHSRPLTQVFPLPPPGESFAGIATAASLSHAGDMGHVYVK